MAVQERKREEREREQSRSQLEPFLFKYEAVMDDFFSE